MEDVTDDDDDEVIQPNNKVEPPPPCDTDDDDEELGLDKIDEETLIRKEAEKSSPAPLSQISAFEEEEEDDGVRTSMGRRPNISAAKNGAAPSALQEEREARQNGDGDDEDCGSETFEDDPDLVRDKQEYERAKPIVREMGKSKACYRCPFSACVHMPFVTETAEPIKSYSMTAERFTEQVGKNQDTTKEIIASMTPSKLAQQICIFKVYSSKSTTNSLRRYAAFVRVKVTDFEDGSGLKETLADGQALYQLHHLEFSKLFRGEHALKLPRSLVPTSKAVEYVRLVPKSEAEARPEGWITIPSVSDCKTTKRSKGEKSEKEKKKQKTTPAPPADTVADTEINEERVMPISSEVYDNYAFVADGSLPVAAPPPPPPPPRAAPAANSAPSSRSETYKIDLSTRTTWPTILPSFAFDTSCTLDVTFTMTRN